MVGLVAALLTTFGFVPQVIKIFQTKDTSAISLGMYAMTVSGIALWFWHGINIGDIPLMLANGVSLLLTGTILICKLRYK
ncbi:MULTISPECIES: SemiSWEET transporter [Streptococcus]|uniref:MtN3 and saliva related transmembrane protein n=1 Tax=Streptococcus porcorum TaxID=701526 RepID=A0ABV2JGU4_9STRE|nr:SemiSWEET transporter [Streptococcus sp.]MDY3824870.1 SemiSWEET transporter [Streptococcus sp.]